MELIVDLHVHSHYAYATSNTSDLENLYKWGKIKGITVIGTGDFTHPQWFAELQQRLEPAEPGLFKLKDVIAKKIDETLPSSIKNNPIRFILTTEVSTIYYKNGKARKLHSLITLPSFSAVKKFNNELSKKGRLDYDGRPVIGIDCKDLLKLSLLVDTESLFIPAHIWTPWFGMFGSKSGFDSIEEAFEELAQEVKAIETGHSSDPFMNWRVDELQKVAVISNSDAHSPSKLGREATVFNTDLDYFKIINSIKKNDEGLVGTIEFFPDEGKYHYDGHRACKVRFSPEETKRHKGVCPVCHRPLTVGVEYRVDELANHPEEYRPPHHKTVEYIIPVIEIISELLGVKSGKKLQEEYQKIYTTLGNEFEILRKISVEDISQQGFPQLAYAVDRLRKKDITIIPGYDGVYGVIQLFSKDRQDQITIETF